MEAIIWGNDSVDGVDHGESCAAFASLTLELGAQATGQESWVTGGTSYPWPLHQWADVRVDPNPASPGIISVLQDAQAHHRWHPLGDGYQPEPGDWVLFDGHVEVVTRYSAGVLYTIGGDSGPNLSVNVHTYTAPLAAQGVEGFVNNGELVSAVSPATSAAASGTATGGSRGGRHGHWGRDGRNPAAGPAGRGNGERRRGSGSGSLGGRAHLEHQPDGQRRPGRPGEAPRRCRARQVGAVRRLGKVRPGWRAPRAEREAPAWRVRRPCRA